MAMPALAPETPQEVFSRLMAARRGDPLEETLARMLASWTVGIGAMPARLGLAETEFRRMMRNHFPAFDASWMAGLGRPMDGDRRDETADLRRLLMENRSGRTASEIWMVEIVIAGCLGSDHLWQDLGLWCRADLSRLMLENFEPLARRNHKDMKWKRFLYKQLCLTEGIYTCRAPSCELCVDYAQCFGPEE